MKILNALIASVLVMSIAGEATAEPVVGLPTYRPKIDASIEFPAPERAARRSGVFVPAQNIAMVTPGMKKSQIYTLLDIPHFYEGFNVRRWNYIFNFYTGNGDEYRACQYQIRFADKGRIEQTYFQDAECAALLDRLLTPVTKTVAVAPASALAVVDPAIAARTYGFTFAFNSAEISPQGLAILQEAAVEANRGGYREVIATGFTDTMGSIEYNDALAARRAAAVADALRGRLERVPVYSRASRDLEVPTATAVRELRNRRVQIELYGTALDRPAPTTIR